MRRCKKFFNGVQQLIGVLMKKKIDERIKILIENCVKTNHRSLFLIVGDRGLYQIVNLHMLLQKARVKSQPTVLWCYKNELEVSSSKKKRMKQIKKLEQKGQLDKDEINQIELFMSGKDIRYAYYKDTHKILGQTFGMCVLQDFESITPNVLCRAIETVEGGGMVIMLFNTLTSLKQLYTISMDVHSRYRTESHQVVQPRFNERFILSLVNCKTCMAIDDELNILPLTQSIKDIKAIKLPGQKDSDSEQSDNEKKQFNEQKTSDLYLTAEQRKLKDLKSDLRDTKPIGNLVAMCKTYDQATSVMQLVDKVSEKSLKSTISLTAGRGRGKSASLGIAIASAIVYGFSNIFVTAPSPENLGTVFEFFFKGLDALNYKEHTDYEILQSTNPEFNHAVVRVNIYRDHRQTIQYIQPQDHAQLSQAELVVIDEAAAIPITLVRQLLGPYMVILSSTIHGYEGTGRSLSLKLLNSLREQSQARVFHQKTSQQQTQGGNQRSLSEVQLDEPIRYGKNDPIESWLNQLLCLDATQNIETLKWGFPHPNQCELYYVNRDTLFSYHSSSEQFLSKLMNIFVSSHYKNTPNDLQMLSDAPAHQIFVLLGPLEDATKHGQLPDILVAIQVAFEGDIGKQNIAEQLKRGLRPSGDLIPWTVSEQFQDDKFGQLNGIRIVRIATHPAAQARGYGTRALQQLYKYYEGQLLDADATLTNEADQFKLKKVEEISAVDDKFKPKKHLKPILQKLSERKPISLHWIGTSFGVTKELFQFWQKNEMQPIYLRQTANELTGEHSCLMIKPLKNTEVGLPDGLGSDWLSAYTNDFRRRMISLLGYEFSKLTCGLAFSFMNRPGLTNTQVNENETTLSVTPSVLAPYITLFDLKRLESYSKNLVDFHLIMDLLPALARLYFSVLPLGVVNLSPVQAAILVGVGLQHKSIDVLQEDLNLQANQLLPMLNKAMRKFTNLCKQSYEAEIVNQIEEEENKAKKIVEQFQTRSTPDQLENKLNQDDLTTKMQQEKDKFIQKHAISSHYSKIIDQGVKIANVVSLPRKRSAEEELDTEVAELKPDKKRRKK